MGGVELHRLELGRVGATGLHEVQRVVDLPRELLVALPGRGGLHEVLVPGVHLAQVGVTTGGEGAHQVQRRGRGVVHALEPLGVRNAGLFGEGEAVDGVAAVGRQGDASRVSVSLERGLEYWPAMRPTLTTGTEAAYVRTALIWSSVFSLARMWSADTASKASAQSPPWSSASPLATAPDGRAADRTHRENEGRIRLEVRDDSAQCLGIGVRRLLRRGKVSPGRLMGGGLGFSVHGHLVHITASRVPSGPAPTW